MLSLRFYIAFILSSVTILVHAQDTRSKASVKISGEGTRPLTLSMEDLLKMKPVTTSLKDRGGAEHSYKGVNLREILELAGATTGNQLRGENLTKYLLVKCADGYELVFSLAELDSSFTDRVVTLAYESDGKALPAGTGPFRLVVPGEKKPARSGHQVIEMVVKFAKD